MPTTIRVWDLPTRVFHWALVIFIVGSVTTVQIGGDAMTWHFRCGYAVLSLLLFRLVWGVVGGHWSRFTSFIYSPGTVFRYFKGQGLPEHSIGHNPLGAVSVFALLGLLLLQVGTGLFSDDEIATSGPLVKFASNAMVSAATFYHGNIGKLVLLVLIVIHIGAIIFYYFSKGDNLVRPMVWGDKVVFVAAQSARDDAISRTLAVAVFLGCAMLVAWIVNLAE